MSREDPQINLRVPPEVKQWLIRKAAENMRSLNAEAVLAIKEKMAAAGSKFGDQSPAAAGNNSIQENDDAGQR